MSFKKKMLAFLAVSALSAATAVPAMALENEFHGMYQMKYFVSNLDNGAAGFYAPTAEKVSAMNYFEQRARLFYNAKANENLKMVLAFEIDSQWGDRAQGGFTNVNLPGGTTGTVNSGTAFRNSGGALDTDAVNLETKWVYVDFNVPGAPVNVKVGEQAIKDSLKGILFDVDAGGIYTTSKLGDVTVKAGYFRGYEGIGGDTGGAKLGVNNLDLAILEGKLDLSKDLSVGAAYYGIFDYRQSTATWIDHTLAVNADAKIGPIALSGFVAGQVGTFEDKTGHNLLPNGTSKQDLTGFAANIAARVAAGPGTAHAAFLYTSGDDGKGSNSAWQSLQQTVNGAATTSAAAGTLAQATSLNSYNESNMMLLNRDLASGTMTTDRELVATANNKNQGLTGIFVGYDANLSSKVFANANLGFALASENNSTAKLRPGTNSSNFLGTEVNAEVGYKMYDNLTTKVQAAYVVLGDYYKGTATGSGGTQDPMNPYTARLVVSYAF